jgi:hypothetical protein
MLQRRRRTLESFDGPLILGVHSSLRATTLPPEPPGSLTRMVLLLRRRLLLRV